MKKLVALILTAAMVFCLCACGGGSDTTAADTAESGDSAAQTATTDDPIVLTFAAHFSNTITLGEVVSQAKEILEEKSGGTMTLDMYFNEALMKQGDTFVGVGQGIADIAYIPSQNLGDVQMAGIFKILYPAGALDTYTMTDIYRGAMEETQLQDNLAEYNLHCLAVRALGGKQLCTSKVKVTTPEDLKGMNVGANGNDSYFFSECGAGAVALSNADYYTGLSNGLVGGITNHYVSIVTYNLNEVAKYITEFGGGLEVAAETYMMNLDTWNSLTEEQQQWVTETFLEVSDMMQDSDAADLVADRQVCLDTGVEIYTLSEDELAAFAPYMEKVNNDWITSATEAGWDAQGAYDYIISAVDAASGTAGEAAAETADEAAAETADEAAESTDEAAADSAA